MKTKEVEEGSWKRGKVQPENKDGGVANKEEKDKPLKKTSKARLARF